ncbi:HAUS augmin-like complex subunit 3 [Manacus candei]|uniref:HAUS augmin-like complex subunit 3 n=1 Tax=Manacus candei TaxID=415023 RepID=UPI002225D22B|nr:HAUS augmin-like complex subunit 3 [Manacus candei]
MSSWRYSQAFPLDTVNRAADFMATLRLIYPHADTLCEKDFEWLFDCPKTKQFLEWFCSTVGEENMLSPAEVEDYDALLAAGKPILEGDALEEALQMCCQVPQLPSMIPEDKGPSPKALQQELQELKDYHDLQFWRYSKLLAWTDKLQQEQRYLEDEEKVVKQDLRMAQRDLEMKVFQTRAVLSQVSNAEKQLTECHGNMGKGQQPSLLCQMDLGPYMELEQKATDAFENFIQQVLPGRIQASDAWEARAQGESSLKEGLEAGTQMGSYWEISERGRGAPYQECAKTPGKVAPASQGMLVQESRAELLVEGSNEREVLSMEGEEKRDDNQEVTDKMNTKKTSMPESLGSDEDELLEDQDCLWKELGRIETAHICAQREVIVMSAKVEGNHAALEWAQRTLEALEDNQHAVEVKLQGQAEGLQNQIHILCFDMTHTLTHQLPPLLKAEARRAHLPALHRHLSLEAAWLQNTARRQEEAAAWVLGQQNRMDLLELQLERDRQELEHKAAWLGKVENAMREEAQSRLQEQQNYFKDASSSQKHRPRKWIDPKDVTAARLWDMLMHEDHEKQPFRSYEAIAAKCSQLVEKKRALESQLVAPMPQIPALEASIEVLYRRLYNSHNQLQLSSPEITELMQQLKIMQDKLYKMLVDLWSDLQVKRRSLQENPTLQTERNLYVYFYCNEDRLREEVEELEKQARASSKGCLMELPYAKE